LALGDQQNGIMKRFPGAPHELGVGGVNFRQDFDAETWPIWHDRFPYGFSWPALRVCLLVQWALNA
jgi:hypothetical protein